MRFILSVLVLCSLAPMLQADYIYYSPADSILYIQFPTVIEFDEDYVLLRCRDHGQDIDQPAVFAPGLLQASTGTPGELLVRRDSLDGSRWFLRTTDWGESWTVAPLGPFGLSAWAMDGYAGQNPGESWALAPAHSGENGNWAFMTHDGWQSYDSLQIPTRMGDTGDSVGMKSLTHVIGTLYGVRWRDGALCVTTDTGRTWAAGSPLTSAFTQWYGAGARDEIWYRHFFGAHVVQDTGRTDLGPLFEPHPPYPQHVPFQSWLAPTDHPGEAYLVLWYDEWPPPPYWSLMHLWIYHIQNYGATVDSSYHRFLDFKPLAVESPTVVVPQALQLSIAPNPFNSTTQILYALPRAGWMSLRVYDVTGREVVVLVDEVMNAGEQRVAFNGQGLASGIYFVRLAGAGQMQTRKVLLVR